MKALIVFAMGLLPLMAMAYLPAISKAGYFEAERSPRKIYDLNVGWSFVRGDGYTARVNLPHTLNVVGFEASGGTNYQGAATYEKQFDFTPTAARQFLHFEAIMGRSRIELNGALLGEHFGGFLPIHLEVTGKLKQKGNVLKVFCDNSDDPETPPGKPQAMLDFSYFGGIYRDVWLVETGATAISDSDKGGVYVATKRLAEKSWQVSVQTTLDGDGRVRLFYEGKEVPATFTVSAPAEWTPDSPALHFLRVEALRGETVSDAVAVRFGFREVAINGQDGLVLNGQRWRKLIGANRHQDFAFIGNAQSNLLHYRDAVKLREAGLTCIRNAHYPQDPAFMDACDEVGLFVMVNTPGWQFWNNKPVFAERVFDDITKMVRRDRSHASVLLWEPILNETWYPGDFAQKTYNIVKREAALGPNLNACDATARGQEVYDVIFRHPKGSTSDEANNNSLEVRPTFTREFGDCVDDWNSHNSPSRVDKQWGEIPQLTQARHYLASTDRDHPVTELEMLLKMPARHFGGALWHSFDHARGYHPDTFYGGLMTSARLPKASYWAFKAKLAAVGPKIPNVDLSPFVYSAHFLTPFSPKEITLYSNVKIEAPKLFDKPLHEIAPFTYMTENDKGYSFYDLKAMVRGGKKGRAVISGTVAGKPFTFKPSYRHTNLALRLDTMRTPLIANGSELVVAVATLTDDAGTPHVLATERIRFAVEGPAEIVNCEDGQLNPQTTRFGEAVVLLRMGTVPGKVTLRAEVDRKGVNVRGSSAISFVTLPARTPLIYDTPAPLAPSAPLHGKNTKPIDLSEIERQQSDFGE
ncbi:MAG: glycoside hydrolase family 2 TIM barrel-domain containing protein [Kiritimatiellia bacterium]